MIRAPYNFIPYSDIVYTPNWANEVSHDQPFEDGVCGRIDYEIEAKMPIFIKDGNGTQRQNNDDNNSTPREAETFFKLGDKYAIPGSSIKGMVRNVFEIMTFSQLHTAETKPYAYRDWENETLYNKSGIQRDLRCGYIRRKKDGSYYIIDCGKPIRISHVKIDEYINSSDKLFKRYFSSSASLKGTVKYPEGQEGSKEYDPKMSEFKYKLCGLRELKGLRFSEDEEASTKHDTRVQFDENGTITGRIVLTGQPSTWKEGDTDARRGDQTAGKFYEFIFKRPARDADKPFLDVDLFNSYKSIYSSSVGSQQWAEYEAELEQTSEDSGMPVFYRKKSNKNEILDFGLAYLYKMFYESSPKDRLPDVHTDDTILDMAKTLFGTIYSCGEDDKKETVALKGRVQFGHAVACSAAEVMSEKSYVLSSPKPTYYPTYIRQENMHNKTYKTYNDGQLSGWKRYINRYTLLDSNVTEKTGGDVITTFRPLKEGVKFKGSMHFHNLKEVELGALLSALTLHNSSEAYHQIGKAKAFGYGRISLKLNIDDSLFNWNNPQRDKLKLEELIGLFEVSMNKAISGEEWVSTPQMKELATLTQTIVENIDLYSYMLIDNKEGVNEFTKAKDSGKNNSKEVESIRSLSTHDGIAESKCSFKSFGDEEKTLKIYSTNAEQERTRRDAYTNKVVTPRIEAVENVISSFEKQYNDLPKDELTTIQKIQESLETITRLQLSTQKNKTALLNELKHIKDISKEYLFGTELDAVVKICDNLKETIEDLERDIKGQIEKHESNIKIMIDKAKEDEQRAKARKEAGLSYLENAKTLGAGVGSIKNFLKVEGAKTISNLSDLETIKSWLISIAPGNGNDRKKYFKEISKKISEITSDDFANQCVEEIVLKFKK